jgi:hypothetical protein
MSKRTNLKDFDIVAHVIPVEKGHFIQDPDGVPVELRSLFINKYGLEVGALVYIPDTKQLMTWDNGIWEEYLHFEQERKDKRNPR